MTVVCSLRDLTSDTWPFRSGPIISLSPWLVVATVEKGKLIGEWSLHTTRIKFIVFPATSDRDEMRSSNFRGVFSWS